MLNGQSPRIQLSLTIWTLLLIALVLVEIRHVPAGLTVLLVPYLVLMAWHWMRRLRHRDHGEPALSLDDAAESPSDDGPDQRADSPGPAEHSGYNDSPLPASLRPTEEQATLPSRRGRARRRSSTPEGESLAASWVQIRPGQLRPGGRDGAGAPGRRPRRRQPDRRAASGYAARRAGGDPGGRLDPRGSRSRCLRVRGRGESRRERDSRAPRPGRPEDRCGSDHRVARHRHIPHRLPARRSRMSGSSPPRSGAGAEVEPDDRRQEMFRAEMPEMDPGRDEPIDLARRHDLQQATEDQEDEEARGRHRDERS